MNTNLVYGLGVMAAGSAVVFFKHRKAKRLVNIQVDSLTWKGGIDTTIVYTDGTGKTQAVYECPNDVWRLVRTDITVSPAICQALKKKKLEHLITLKNKIKVKEPTSDGSKSL